MRLNIPRIAAFFVCVIALFWFIPNFYGKATRVDRFSLSGMFSPTLKEFIIWEIGADKMVYKNEKGEVLNTVEAQKNMPFLFSSSVSKWGGFPLTIDNQTFTYDDARKNTQAMRLSPRYVFSEPLPIHMLLESSPKGASLEASNDVVVFKQDRLDFIYTANGTKNIEKSKQFTKSLLNAGLVFPIKFIATNPSTLKSFDEGMLFIDSKNKVYHLKMIKGEPSVRDTEVNIPDTPLYISLSENERKLYYGLIATNKDVYMYTYEDKLLRLPLDNFNPKDNSLALRFTPLYQTIIKNDLTKRDAPIEYTATDLDFNSLHVNNQTFPENILDKFSLNDKGLSILTPFVIKQYTYDTVQTVFDIKLSPSLLFVFLGILFAEILYFAHIFFWKIKLDKTAPILILFSGIPGLIAILLFGPISKK
ncbi:MAG: DUF4857 domain-containing protein [Campylobacteraceae bacterium]